MVSLGVISPNIVSISDAMLYRAKPLKFKSLKMEYVKTLTFLALSYTKCAALRGVQYEMV